MVVGVVPKAETGWDLVSAALKNGEESFEALPPNAPNPAEGWKDDVVLRLENALFDGVGRAGVTLNGDVTPGEVGEAEPCEEEELLANAPLPNGELVRGAMPPPVGGDVGGVASFVESELRAKAPCPNGEFARGGIPLPQLEEGVGDSLFEDSTGGAGVLPNGPFPNGESFKDGIPLAVPNEDALSLCFVVSEPLELGFAACPKGEGEAELKAANPLDEAVIVNP